jgi:predicted nucleic acid-binding protein
MVLLDTDVLEKFLRPYALYWPDWTDCARAYDDFASFHLSRNLGIMDVLIAETAIGIEAELATFNTKHYSTVSTLRTVQPYRRI